MISSRATRLATRWAWSLSKRTFAAAPPRRALANPINVPKWLEENSHRLKPPVNNYCVYNDDVTVMVVGGPNARTDYHINQTPEWFYQYKGNMLLKIVDTTAHPLPPSQSHSKSQSLSPSPDPTTSTPPPFRDIHINEGDMFLLPANIPHNPVRFADTVGIVIEQRRPADSIDRLRWYCQSCSAQVHEASFHCTDLGTQIKTAVEAFKADRVARTCRSCGEVCDTAPKGV